MLRPAQSDHSDAEPINEIPRLNVFVLPPFNVQPRVSRHIDGETILFHTQQLEYTAIRLYVGM